eukprot:6050327-Amphidinium_carterae.1
MVSNSISRSFVSWVDLEWNGRHRVDTVEPPHHLITHRSQSRRARMEMILSSRLHCSGSIASTLPSESIPFLSAIDGRLDPVTPDPPRRFRPLLLYPWTRRGVSLCQSLSCSKPRTAPIPLPSVVPNPNSI